MQVGILSVERQRPPDHLNDFGTGPGCQIRCCVPGREVATLAELHLHQLPRAESVVQRLQERSSQPLRPDVHSGGEMMRFRAQGGPVFPLQATAPPR